MYILARYAAFDRLRHLSAEPELAEGLLQPVLHTNSCSINQPEVVYRSRDSPAVQSFVRVARHPDTPGQGAAPLDPARKSCYLVSCWGCLPQLCLLLFSHYHETYLLSHLQFHRDRRSCGGGYPVEGPLHMALPNHRSELVLRAPALAPSE